MPGPKLQQSTFKAYVDLPTKNGISPENNTRRTLQYLPGESLVSCCEDVVRYIPFFDKTQALVGTLFITNFKIAFIPRQSPTDHSGNQKQRNKLVREDDIVLNSVHTIYQVSKGKRRRLSPANGTSGSFIKNLEIHCKDFRVHTLSFKMSEKPKAKMACNALVHHSFPARVELLFAFDSQLADIRPRAAEALPGPSANTEPAVRRFDRERDWLLELERLRVKGFRVLACNSDFQNYPSLPEVLVVPETLELPQIKNFASKFNDYRVPLWSYSLEGGAALVRMASALSTMTDGAVFEERMVSKIRLAHPEGLQPVMYDYQVLCQSGKMPSLRDLSASHDKLKELCMPVTFKEATAKDNSWLSALHSTGWLQHVSRCLALCLEIVDAMLNFNKTVIFKEESSKDMTPVICSLTQLMLDAHYRTITGFQELIEREWVAMGHDFTSRLGLVQDSDPCPLFLLFLDLVWQLHQQFPSAFQFSETYLTALWDTLCLGLFDNFIFDSIRKRQLCNAGGSYGNPNISLLSAWEWHWQFDSEDQSLFNNPLYKARTELNLKLPRSHKGGHRKGSSLRRVYSLKLASIHDTIPSQDVRVLRPVVKQPLMKLWAHNYLRWVTPVQILGGGSPSEYLQQCLLVEEIVLLKHKLDSLRNERTFNKAERPSSDLLFSSAQTLRPAAAASNHGNLTSNLALTSSFPYQPTGARGATALVDTLVSAFLEKSFIQDSDGEQEEEGACGGMETSFNDSLQS